MSSLYFSNHGTLDDQLDTLYKVLKMNVDTIVTSHTSNYFDKKMIDRMINCILNSKNKRCHPYKYPRPPFAQGYIYIDSIEEEPIGLIVENNN